MKHPGPTIPAEGQDEKGAVTQVSNNSPPPLMVTMTPFGNMAPQSKETCILQKYIEFLH
jgi:hypothetical protein